MMQLSFEEQFLEKEVAEGGEQAVTLLQGHKRLVSFFQKKSGYVLALGFRLDRSLSSSWGSTSNTLGCCSVTARGLPFRWRCEFVKYHGWTGTGADLNFCWRTVSEDIFCPYRLQFTDKLSLPRTEQHVFYSNKYKAEKLDGNYFRKLGRNSVYARLSKCSIFAE